jgi:threonine/homoserine/homoserine lactone efflux protein
MWEAIVSGLTLGLVLAISVGPVIFTIIKQSLVNGKEGGFCFVTGVWLSDIVLVVVSNAFSEVVRSLMVYEKPLGLIGSSFLIMMGVFYVFFKKIKLRANPEEPLARFRKRDMARVFSSGFLINTLNPNVFIFWLATATNFAVKYSFRQRMLIFTVCLALNIAADIFKVLMAGRLRSRLTLHNISVINKISGTLLIGFGIALLLGTIFWSEKIN